jgi:hypothetical protein
VHQVDVLDQRSAQGAGHGVTTPIGHQAAPDLLLDLLTKLFESCLYLLLEQSPVELGEIVVGHQVHETLLEVGQIETAKCPVQVIRAAYGTSWLHPGQLVHGGAGPASHRLFVKARKRLEEIIEEGVEIERRSVAPFCSVDG